jgi:tight adherence protein B
MMMYLLLYLAFFTAILSISLLLGHKIKRRQAERRLKEIDGILKKNTSVSDEEKEPSEFWRQVAAVVGNPIRSEKLQDQVGQLIRQSNLPIRKDEFLGLCLLLGISFFFIGWILLKSIMVGILLLLLASYLPFLWAKSRVKKRIKAFQDQLTDMLTMVSNSLKAGYSFLQALELISKEMPAPMSEEFTRLIKETQLGVNTEDALQNLSKRVNNDDLDLVITAVLIQRQTGGNLAQILDSIADTIRERIRIHREIKTLTAQGILSGHIFRVMPIGLGLFIYVVNPQYMGLLFSEPLGWGMMGIALLGQLIGSIFINKIVKIEV